MRNKLLLLSMVIIIGITGCNREEESAATSPNIEQQPASTVTATPEASGMTPNAQAMPVESNQVSNDQSMQMQQPMPSTQPVVTTQPTSVAPVSQQQPVATPSNMGSMSGMQNQAQPMPADTMKAPSMQQQNPAPVAPQPVVVPDQVPVASNPAMGGDYSTAPASVVSQDSVQKM
jgi:hypothetical protein